MDIIGSYHMLPVPLSRVNAEEEVVVYDVGVRRVHKNLCACVRACVCVCVRKHMCVCIYSAHLVLLSVLSNSGLV